MPNPFPGMRFVPRAPRLGGPAAVAEFHGQEVPTWDNPPIQGLGDLARWCRSVDVHPLALPNPYPNSWADVAWPDDLWLVVHRLPYAPVSGYWAGDQVVAVVWRWTPIQADGSPLIRIRDPDGTILHTVTATVADGPQVGVWYLPDDRWDDGLHAVRVEATESQGALSNFALGTIRSPGCLVPRDLPSGWDPIAPGVRGEAGRLPDDSLVSHYNSPAFPDLCSDWGQRYRGWVGKTAGYRSESYMAVPAPAFPRLWRDGAFVEALNAPVFNDIGPCRVGTGYQTTVGGIVGAICWQEYADILSTRSRASFMPPCGLAVIFTGAGTGGGTLTLTVREWGSGTTLYTGTLTAEDMSGQPDGYRQVEVLPITDPGLGPDAVWEVSASFTKSGDVGNMALRIIPSYRPLPFPSVAADGSRVILGGTRAAQRRPVDPRTIIPVLTADPGALTVSAPVSTSPVPANDYAAWLVAFTPPSPGWYKPSVAITTSYGGYAIITEEGRQTAIGGSRVKPWAGPLPLNVLVADGSHPVTTGTVTVSVERKTPAPADLGSSWTELAIPSSAEWPAAWGAFTAPATGRYRLEVAFTDHYYHATPDDAYPDAPRLCAYAAIDDPDAITDAVTIYEAAIANVYGSIGDYAQGPPSYPYGGLMLVGLAPTGAWEGHAGQLARRLMTSSGEGVWSFMDPPEGLVARIHDENSTVRMLRYQDGKWQGWHPSFTVSMEAGQTLTVRAHGPRTAGDDGYGYPAYVGDLFARVVAVT